MRGADKGEVPHSLSAWIGMESENWLPKYPFPPNVRKDVINSLMRDQKGLCVYCGRRIELDKPGKSFHIEHFRPQGKYESLSISYDNIFISCGQNDWSGGISQTCGTRKGDWFEEHRHIYPEYPCCIFRFGIHPDGRMIGLDESAGAMEEVLNLNYRELIRERRELLSLLDANRIELADLYDADRNIAESFAHIGFHYMNEVLR